MSKLRAYLMNRIAEVKVELDDLSAEYAELMTAWEALSHDSPHTNQQRLFENSSPDPESLTIKEKIMHVLTLYPQGGEASKIIDLIGHVFGEEIERTSFSPQLSRLRQEGRVVQVNGKYRARETLGIDQF